MDYDRFKGYLNEMHKEAINILENITESYKSKLSTNLHKFFRGKEHYWSIKKLFCHAMYIPMFLTIGSKYFERLIYIDTHAGLGLAKIGEGDNEIILGSPLIAIKWPEIIASKIISYSKIHDGFDEIYVIERDPNISTILSYIIRQVNAGDKVIVYKKDCNMALPEIAKKICENDSLLKRKRPLLYVFVDPYGDLDNQISYESFQALTKEVNVDIMMTVMSLNTARGFSSLSSEEKKENAKRIFSKEALEKVLSLTTEKGVRSVDIVTAYEITMRSLGYKKIKFIPVRFEKGTLYHMMLAVKSSGKWVDGFVDYIKNKAPQDYETLKGLFLQVVGKQKSIEEFR